MKKSIFERGPSYDDLFLFFLKMNVSYSAGNPSITVLKDLSLEAQNPVLQRALKDMVKDMKAGEDLAATFLKQKCFPPFCGHIIHAGEEKGNLDKCLEEIAYHMEQNSDIFRRIVTAAMPVMTALVVISIALVIFLVYVSPFFEQMFTSMDLELPLINVLMIKFSNFVINFWYLILFSIGVSAWSFRKYTQKNPIIIDKILLRIPIYKVIHYNFLQYKFIKIFKLLRDSGTSSLQAVELTADAVGNEIMAQMLRKTAASMRNGFELPTALEKNNTSKIIDVTVINLIRTGENNGASALNKSLEGAARFYKKFVENKTERFGPAITPWILFPAFALVMLIILSVQYPMLTMMGQGGQ